MGNKPYEVRYLPMFEDDLSEAVDYIANYVVIDNVMEVRRLLHSARDVEHIL